MSEAWAVWLEYNLPQIAIFLVLVVWVGRLWRQQFSRNDAAMQMQRENSELLRRSVALLEEIRDALKGKS